MNLKRFTRGPALYIVLALVLVVAVTAGLRGSDYKPASTAQVFNDISSGQVSPDKNKNILLDKEQEVRVTLTNGKKYQASFLIDQGRDFAAAFKSADVDYNVKVSHENIFLSFLFSVFPVNPKDPPAHIQGKSYRIQTVGFFRWPVETTVPADGLIHFCGFGGLLSISPPGLPNGVPPRLFSGKGYSRLFALNAATGSFDDVQPSVLFSYSGRFDEIRHSIRITATCNGAAATRTYRLSHRF